MVSSDVCCAKKCVRFCKNNDEFNEFNEFDEFNEIESLTRMIERLCIEDVFSNSDKFINMCQMNGEVILQNSCYVSSNEDLIHIVDLKDIMRALQISFDDYVEIIYTYRVYLNIMRKKMRHTVNIDRDNKDLYNKHMMNEIDEVEYERVMLQRKKNKEMNRILDEKLCQSEIIE